MFWYIYLFIFSFIRICIKLDLKTKSYGQNENRHIVIFKKENAHEIFEELINNGLENDNYKLILPKN